MSNHDPHKFYRGIAIACGIGLALLALAAWLWG